MTNCSPAEARREVVVLAMADIQLLDEGGGGGGGGRQEGRRGEEEGRFLNAQLFQLQDCYLERIVKTISETINFSTKAVNTVPVIVSGNVEKTK